MAATQFIETGDGHRVAYVHHAGTGPGILFLGGFRSDMTGSKALFLEQLCLKQGRQFTRFDYFGHGQSSGDFEEGTIGRWAEDAVRIVDRVAEGPQILVGSSMGGWIMLLAALRRPERVAGLVGIASAPDFTELLLWDKFTPEQQGEIKEKGRIELPDCYGETPYPITFELIAESGDHLVFDDAIPIHCPVHLIHGMKDEDVPWEFSLTLNEKLMSKDVRTTLIEDGDHRLSSPEHLQRIGRVVERMVATVENMLAGGQGQP